MYPSIQHFLNVRTHFYFKLAHLNIDENNYYKRERGDPRRVYIRDCMCDRNVADVRHQRFRCTDVNSFRDYH